MNLAPRTYNPAALALAAVVADQVASELELELTVVDLADELLVRLPDGTPDRLREVFVAHLAGRLLRGFTVSAFYRSLDVDGVITVTPWPASSGGWVVDASQDDEALEDVEASATSANVPGSVQGVDLDIVEQAPGSTGENLTAGSTAPSTLLNSGDAAEPRRRPGRPPGSKTRHEGAQP